MDPKPGPYLLHCGPDILDYKILRDVSATAYVEREVLDAQVTFGKAEEKKTTLLIHVG